MSSISKKVVVGLSAVVFAYVATGYLRARGSDDKAYHALTVYSEVLDKIQREYVSRYGDTGALTVEDALAVLLTATASWCDGAGWIGARVRQ